eukprot:1679067-Ditylum_brightwellii.AAC.1
MESNTKCKIPHLGTHWFNAEAITNIISLSDMTDRYKVTFDSAEDKALLVHLPHKIIHFYQMKNGLYGMNPKSDLQPEEK